MFAGGNLWSHFVVRIFRFAASFPVEWAFFFLLCACAWNMYSRKFFPTRMECSLSIRQQKHKRKEISFCSSNVWEKHLEESGKEGDTEGREHKEDKGCVRGDLSVLGFMGFFWGGVFAVCEFCAACWDGSSLRSVSRVKFQSEWLPIRWSLKNIFRKEKNNKCNVLMSAEVLSGRHIDSWHEGQFVRARVCLEYTSVCIVQKCFDERTWHHTKQE